MIREYLTRSAALSLPLAAMLLFIALFAAAVWFAARRRAAAQFDHMASLPLNDGEESGT